MSESIPETSSSVETPKSGSIAMVKGRISAAIMANANRVAQEGISERERQRAEELQRMHFWQLEMIDSLAVARAYEEINTTGDFDTDKAANDMTALEGAERLEEWIKKALDSPDPDREEDDMPDSVARRYAEDLRDKLFDEASRMA